MRKLVAFLLMGFFSQMVLAELTQKKEASQMNLFKPQYIAFTKYVLQNPTPINLQAIHYWVDYTSNCEYKVIPLKHAILTIKVYYNGNPMGRMNIETDALQHFAFDGFDKFREKSLVSLEVESIQTQENHHAKCYGYVRPMHRELLITCDQIKQG